MGHTHSDCHFRELACHKCGKIGHLAKICRSSKGDNKIPPRKKTVHHVEETVKDSPEEGDLYVIRSSPKLQPYKTDVEVNGKILQMELDTGASLSLVSEKMFRENWSDLEVSQSETTLYSYSGESIPVVRLIRVSVKYEDQESLLPLLIVEGDCPSLLDRNWLSHLKINWHKIFWLQNDSLNNILEKFKGVFE